MPILELSKKNRKWLEDTIFEQDKWKPKEYNLEFLAEWPNERLPIVVAIPTERKVDWSPIFVKLPNDTFMSSRDPNTFSTIIKNLGSTLTPADGEFLALIALKFGHFPRPPGHLWNRSLDSKVPLNKRPRHDSKPVLKVDNGKIELAFYAYDFELLRISDCHVYINLKETVIKLESKDLLKG